MARTNLLIVGSILVLAGGGLSVVGYLSSRPSGTERTLGAVAELLDRRLPSGLASDKTAAYAMLVVGILAFVGGLVTILKSGKSGSKPGP